MVAVGGVLDRSGKKEPRRSGAKSREEMSQEETAVE
jgi:hypothetical protein